MNLQDIGLTQNQQTILHRFIAACQRDAMLWAVLQIVQYYQATAPPLAKQHDLTYPAELERLVVERLNQLLN